MSGSPRHPDSTSYGPNDLIAPRIRNRNPMNLERMGMGYKPKGFPMEREPRNYWNKLELSIKGGKWTNKISSSIL